MLFQYDRDDVDIFPFFSVGFAKKCTDYILFYPHMGKLYIFLIELKSNVYKPAYKQFFATKSFTEYILKMAKSNQIIKRNKNIVKQKVEMRCILLSTNKRAGSKPLTNPRTKLQYTKHKEYGLDYTILRPGHPIYINLLCS